MLTNAKNAHYKNGKLQKMLINYTICNTFINHAHAHSKYSDYINL